ncbi:MAG: hypothetical protein J6333_00875, partial [Planctomycetes bacterium]|nr:hypothetical protein [Planctomycetota bacterium]
MATAKRGCGDILAIAIHDHVGLVLATFDYPPSDYFSDVFRNPDAGQTRATRERAPADLRDADSNLDAGQARAT